MAEARVGSFTLQNDGMPTHELFSSCEPCAMCLGATLWSGVTRLVFAATREDATRLNFDEGPVFPESYRYLADRGITVERGRLREEATAVFDLYLERGGPIYNR
jgi:tRNA(Arg) A34 adenosine deaminase TadA